MFIRFSPCSAVCTYAQEIKQLRDNTMSVEYVVQQLKVYHDQLLSYLAYYHQTASSCSEPTKVPTINDNVSMSDYPSSFSGIARSIAAAVTTAECEALLCDIAELYRQCDERKLQFAEKPPKRPRSLAVFHTKRNTTVVANVFDFSSNYTQNSNLSGNVKIHHQQPDNHSMMAAAEQPAVAHMPLSLPNTRLEVPLEQLEYHIALENYILGRKTPCDYDIYIRMICSMYGNFDSPAHYGDFARDLCVDENAAKLLHEHYCCNEIPSPPTCLCITPDPGYKIYVISLLV